MPPFTAPPTDRNRRGLWIGLGVGALVVVLCCVGGIFGFVLIAVSGSKQIERDAVVVVQDYLGALRDKDYDAAYDLLCPALTSGMTPAQFTEQQRRKPDIAAYQVGTAQVGNAIVVPADIRYTSGSRDAKRFELNQEFGGDLLICGGIS